MSILPIYDFRRGGQYGRGLSFDKKEMEDVNLAVRKIIKIDEEKCDGCRLCIPQCAEGALQIINGKGKHISEHFREGLETPSNLGHWPIQQKLVPPNAPYFQEADLLIAADCIPFVSADFHRDLLKGKPLFSVVQNWTIPILSGETYPYPERIFYKKSHHSSYGGSLLLRTEQYRPGDPPKIRQEHPRRRSDHHD